MSRLYALVAIPDDEPWVLDELADLLVQAQVGAELVSFENPQDLHKALDSMLEEDGNG